MSITRTTVTYQDFVAEYRAHGGAVELLAREEGGLLVNGNLHLRDVGPDYECECPLEPGERRVLHLVTDHEGHEALCAYCPCCEDLARVDWNGETASVVPVLAEGDVVVYNSPSWGRVEGRVLNDELYEGRVLVQDLAPTGAREWWPVADVAVRR